MYISNGCLVKFLDEQFRKKRGREALNKATHLIYFPHEFSATLWALEGRSWTVIVIILGCTA
jgi:hypothetical protein